MINCGRQTTRGCHVVKVHMRSEVSTHLTSPTPNCRRAEVTKLMYDSLENNWSETVFLKSLQTFIMLTNWMWGTWEEFQGVA